MMRDDANKDGGLRHQGGGGRWGGKSTGQGCWWTCHRGHCIVRHHVSGLGGGDDNAWAKDDQGLCIVDGGCLINNAKDGNVETATGWVPYKARDMSYVGGRPEDGIILSGRTMMRGRRSLKCRQ
jgi:hypothetical protein